MYFSATNVAKCNLGYVECKTMLASGISHGSGVGWLGVSCSSPTWLRAQPPMSSDLRFVNKVQNTGLLWIPYLFGLV